MFFKNKPIRRSVKREFSNRSGFTLIEILLAIVLITLACIPLMQIVIQGLRTTKKEERVTKVVFLAERKMEETLGKVRYDSSVSQDSSGAFTSPYADYRYIVTDNEASDIKTIAVSVWFDENGDESIDSDEDFISLNTKFSDIVV